MTTIQEYKTFLGQVAKAAGLEPLEPDDEGLVSLRVEDEYTLNLQFIAATGKILCFVEIAQLGDETPKEAIYRELLTGALFGKDTAGGYFSLEPRSESVIYNYVFDASCGAVAEALANDLTRLSGVPAQELSIIRGKYSDGHPKLMLEAKFANGYHDFDNYCLKDGRIVPPPAANGEAPVEIEDLGKYKAMFLLLADRDAVGSHGQNKGVVGGRFFAIDPGHSLEGNGKDLEIRDDFSFKDKSIGLEKRFRNFSVFDDSTRFEKLTGILAIRDLQRSGKFDALFAAYRSQFDAENASPAEKPLFTKINARIDEMESEFRAQMNKLLSVFGPQLAFCDAFSDDEQAMRRPAIDTIENLEKLTSPTTWTSAEGEVKLKHLEVVESKRIPWTAHMDDGNNLVYESKAPLDAKARSLLANRIRGSDVLTCEFDDKGHARISVAKGEADVLFEVLSERHVMEDTHPDEFRERYPQ